MIALIDLFKEEMLERGFSAHHIGIKVNLERGTASLVKSEDACKRQSEVLNYIREREIDDIDTYTHEEVMELACDFVGDKIVVCNISEYDGNSEWYVDLLDYWIEIFSHVVAEIAMHKYFNTEK